MRRLWAVGLSVVLLGQSAYLVHAGDWRTPTPATETRQVARDVSPPPAGVLLGRPQTIADEPSPAADIRLISFADGIADVKPVPRQPTSSGFASRAPAWPAPPAPAPAGNVWGSGFASSEPESPKPRAIASSGPEPIPAPRSSGTPIASSDSACCGEGEDCCFGRRCCLGRLANCFHCRSWDKCYCSAEYLFWGIKSYETPTLLTTGTPASGGIIGAPGTSVVFGGSLSPDVFSGGRFTLGIWLDAEKATSIEATYLFLGQRSRRLSASSNDFPVLARPFYSINSGTENAILLAAPGVAIGATLIDAPSQFWSQELNLRCNLAQNCNRRLDAILGFRYLELQEGLKIASASQDLTTGALSVATDNFDTFNQFYGPQLGVKWECKGCRWSLDLGAKIAFGDSHRSVTIFGNQFVSTPSGSTTTAAAGLLALPSNTGRFHDDHFAVVPEASFNLGYQVTDGLRVFVGYTFIYWSSVFRPGDQIDRLVDASQIPNVTPPVASAGQLRPLPLLKGRDFWAQGMNFGLEYRY